MDAGTDVSLTGELNDRWDFFGNPKDFKSSRFGIPFFPGAGDPKNPIDRANPTSNAACNAQALAMDGGDINVPANGAR